jgi:hypothetical protein
MVSSTLIRKIIASGEARYAHGRRFRMCNYLFSKLTMAALFGLFAIPTLSQVAPTATVPGGLSLDAGVGFSSYHMDFGPGVEFGGALWIDAGLNMGPSYLHGLGGEIEARDLSLDPGGSLPRRFRTDTAGGGPIYTVEHFRRFKPYVKFIVSFGSIDYRFSEPKYGHLTWTVYAPGGGIDWRVFKNLSVRADYEYQDWSNLFLNGKDLNPEGVTLGFVYEIKHRDEIR